MTLLTKIQEYAKSLPAEVKESRGAFELTYTVAERKAFLSNQKLQYIARFRVLDDQKIVNFAEMLKESGSGISTGGDMDSAPGFGFKTEVYKTKGVSREVSIEQQSDLFGKKYSYQFDMKTIRSRIESLAKTEGYQFQPKLIFKDV